MQKESRVFAELPKQLLKKSIKSRNINNFYRTKSRPCLRSFSGQIVRVISIFLYKNT